MSKQVLSLSVVLSLLFAAFAAPAPVTACEQPGCHGLHLSVRVGARVRGRAYARPICRMGRLHPGCVAPIRKAARGIGRALVRTGRFLGGVARGIGRFLFGRSWYA